MNVEVRRTPAELALAASIEALRPRLPGGREAARLREDAAKAFAESGLPHRRIEEWKYTDLRALMREALPLANPPDKRALELARKADPISGVQARRIVLVNGVFVAELSDLSKLETGLTILPLARALTDGLKLTQQIGALKPETYDAALALNTAFLSDGAVIEIGKGAKLERPIHLMHYFAERTPAATFARTLVVVRADARATLFESFIGADEIAYHANSALELHVGEGAHVNLIRLQAEGNAALHLATLLAELGAKAHFNLCSLNTGAAVARHSVSLNFAGGASEALLASANLLRGKQHADTTLVINHALPGGKSRAINKSALDDESRGVFQGRIVVRPGAQKTDAKMMTGALLLGEAAEADNKPELEIFADDVQCGHGATAGALDEDLLFYLRSRGIPLKEAEALMIESFVSEAFEGITHEGLRDMFAARVRAWLKARA